MKYSLILFFLFLFIHGYPKEPSKTIGIYPDKVITCCYIGNGVQWSAYPHADSPDSEWGDLMTPKKWKMIFDRLDYMQPKLVRVMDQANWRYLKGFDAQGEPILDFNSPEVKTLEKLLDYCQKNKITVLFGEWGCPSQIKNSEPSGHFKGANDPKWTNIIVKYLDFLINTSFLTDERISSKIGFVDCFPVFQIFTLNFSPRSSFVLMVKISEIRNPYRNPI